MAISQRVLQLYQVRRRLKLIQTLLYGHHEYFSLKQATHTHIIRFILVQDFDHDGKLSPLDYTTAVTKENLLLQAFGKCLPGRQVCVPVPFLKGCVFLLTYKLI